MSITMNDTNTHNMNMNKNLHNNNTNTTTKFDKSSIGQPNTATTEEKMVLFEEQLQVGKREVDGGAVKIDKRVETQGVSVPVTLKREEAIVERRPITTNTNTHSTTSTTHPHSSTAFTGSGSGSNNLHSASSSTAFQPQTIKVTTQAEQAVAEKTILPKEEVSVSKTRVNETRFVNDTVRKEDAEVTKNLANTTPGLRVDQAMASHSHHDVGDKHHGGGHGGAVMGSDGRIVAFEEKLAVGKETVKTGEIGVTKRVENVPVSEAVNIGHDRVTVTHRPLDHTNINKTPLVDTSSAFTSGSTTIGLKADEIIANKHVVPKEEIVVKKKQEIEQKSINTTLRSEHIDAHMTQPSSYSSSSSSSYSSCSSSSCSSGSCSSSSCSTHSSSSAPLSSSTTSTTTTTTTKKPKSKWFS